MNQLFVPLAIGLAVTGLVLLGIAGWRLARHWRTLPPRWKWIFFAALGLAEISIWLCVYAFLIEPRTLVVRRVEIVSEHWHGAPIRIVAIGDTHVGGPHMSAARMGRIVQRINALRPDLVVLLGDYVNGHRAEAGYSPAEQQEMMGGIATFAALNARYGAVSIIGNHDFWYGQASISAALENAGVAVLWNRSVVIRTSTRPIVVAGLADKWVGSPNIIDALDGAPADADTIVLAHNPDAFADARAGPALFLGAHTHCGQVTVPFFGRPVLPLVDRRLACHLAQIDGKTIYVTGGIGTSGLPVRFLNPPEIVLITLRGSAAD